MTWKEILNELNDRLVHCEAECRDNPSNSHISSQAMGEAEGLRYAITYIKNKLLYDGNIL